MWRSVPSARDFWRNPYFQAEAARILGLYARCLKFAARTIRARTSEIELLSDHADLHPLRG
jgi:hypothetical protein